MLLEIPNRLFYNSLLTHQAQLRALIVINLSKTEWLLSFHLFLRQEGIKLICNTLHIIKYYRSFYCDDNSVVVALQPNYTLLCPEQLVQE